MSLGRHTASNLGWPPQEGQEVTLVAMSLNVATFSA
jgi:hypothetical protein